MTTEAICACGCGERIEFKRHHKYSGTPKYVWGHASRDPAVKTGQSRSVGEGPNPSGLCLCGCGQKTPLAKSSKKDRGDIRGQPIRYVAGHQPRRKGSEHPNWQGGRIVRRGYVLIHMPEHPHADTYGYVPEHQLVACEALGRWLADGEVVHHINGVKDDNRPDNLVVITAAEHAAFHKSEASERAKAQHAADPERASRNGKKGAKARWG